MSASDKNVTREATADEIRRYKAGEQKLWRCPKCGHTVEVLSGLMVACVTCMDERHEVVWMTKEAQDA